MRFLKLLSVTLAAGALIAALALLSAKPCFEGGQSYTYFCGNTSKSCREVVSEGNPAAVRLTLTGVCGECAEYEEFDLESYLSKVNGQVVFIETLSDSVNYYCKADLPYSIILYGEEINLHVSVKSNLVKVASPIIFGGY